MNKRMESPVVRLLSLGVAFAIFASLLPSQTECREASGRRLSLWIERKETFKLIGVDMDFYIVANGNLVTFLRNSAKEINSRLPILPSELVKVEFMWMGGSADTYTYWFKEIRSLNREILYDPLLSVRSRGTVPRNSTGFHLSFPCTFQSTGIASFIVEFHLRNGNEHLIPGFPLRLLLRKNCDRIPNALKTTVGKCDIPCLNGGVCNQKRLCTCAKGYTGKLCQKATCSQWCGVHGRCIEFNKCKCHRGWRGRLCNKTLDPLDVSRQKTKHQKEIHQQKTNKTSGREKERRFALNRQKQKKQKKKKSGVTTTTTQPLSTTPSAT